MDNNAVLDEVRPISAIGLTRVATDFQTAIFLLALVNVFVGLLNVVPLYPLDGGHFAVALYEKVRGRHADVRRLLPVAAAVFAFIVVLGILGFYFDIVRPIELLDDAVNDRIRRETTIVVGNVPSGRWCAVSVQSMTTTRYRGRRGACSRRSTPWQGRAPTSSGITCNDVDAAQGLPRSSPRSAASRIVADIHFQYRLALAALEAGGRGLV